MPKWIKVADVEEFEDEATIFEYEGNPIAIFKLEDGFYAIDDTCSHAEASLSEGEVEDHEIECPLHGAVFDLKTGNNLSLPAVVPVKSYPVKIEDNQLYIQVEA